MGGLIVEGFGAVEYGRPPSKRRISLGSDSN